MLVRVQPDSRQPCVCVDSWQMLCDRRSPGKCVKSAAHGKSVQHAEHTAPRSGKCGRDSTARVGHGRQGTDARTHACVHACMQGVYMRASRSLCEGPAHMCLVMTDAATRWLCHTAHTTPRAQHSTGLAAAEYNHSAAMTGSCPGLLAAQQEHCYSQELPALEHRLTLLVCMCLHLLLGCAMPQHQLQ
jgi:hypothetical protein